MFLNKGALLIFFSLAIGAMSQTQRRTRGTSNVHKEILEKGQAEVEAWERWLKASSISIPIKAPVQPPKPPAPTPCIGTPEDLLKILSKVSDPASLKKDGTPQNKAYKWLLTDTFYCYTDASCKLIQRYIMALTYFSTDGEKWTNCGQEGGSSACNPAICRDFGRKPQLGTSRWLNHTSSECKWCGATCNPTNLCMTEIDLDSINVGGTIPFELQNLTILEVLALQRGFIKGTIPSTLGNLKSLTDLDLNFNNITGSIPENLYNAKTLEQLDLNDNALTGTVSSKIGDLKNLFFWQLGNDSPWGKNAFKGTLPSSINGLSNLRVVSLDNVKFEGSLPSFTNDGALEFLDVSGNKFSGNIDNTNWTKPSLQYADLSSNKFTGTIPSSFGGATGLKLGAFDDNDFTGSMPQAVCNNRAGSLKNLTADCAGASPQVTCAFPTCCTGCF